jgi:hypothetical protein
MPAATPPPPPQQAIDIDLVLARRQDELRQQFGEEKEKMRLTFQQEYEEQKQRTREEFQQEYAGKVAEMIGDYERRLAEKTKEFETKRHEQELTWQAVHSERYDLVKMNEELKEENKELTERNEQLEEENEELIEKNKELMKRVLHFEDDNYELTCRLEKLEDETKEEDAARATTTSPPPPQQQTLSPPPAIITVEPRRKEAEKFQLPRVMNAANWDDWTASVILTVSAGAGSYSKEARTWLSTAFKLDSTQEQLETVPKELTSINEKLLMAILAVLSGENHRTATRLQREHLLATGDILSSLIVLSMLHRGYQQSPLTQHASFAATFHSLSYGSDSTMATFLETTESLLHHLRPRESEPVLGAILLRKLKGHSPALDLELSLFKKRPPDEQTSIELCKIMRQHLEEKDQQTNEQIKQKAILQSVKGPPAGGRPAGAATKTPTPGVCYAWREEGKCSRGADCRFAHEEKNKNQGKNKGEKKGKDKEQGKGKDRSKSKDRGKSKERQKQQPPTPRAEKQYLCDADGNRLPQNMVPCTRFAHGNCSRTPCPFLHDTNARVEQVRKGKPAGAATKLGVAFAATAAASSAPTAAAFSMANQRPLLSTSPPMVEGFRPFVAAAGTRVAPPPGLQHRGYVEVCHDSGTTDHFTDPVTASYYPQYETEPVTYASAAGPVVSDRVAVMQLSDYLTIDARVMPEGSPTCFSTGQMTRNGWDAVWRRYEDQAYYVHESGQVIVGNVNPDVLVPASLFPLPNNDSEDIAALSLLYNAAAAPAMPAAPALPAAPAAPPPADVAALGGGAGGGGAVGGVAGGEVGAAAGEEVKAVVATKPRFPRKTDDALHLLTHTPHRQGCPICEWAKSKSAPHFQATDPPVQRPFGESITLDYKIVAELIPEAAAGYEESIDTREALLVIHDNGTSFTKAYHHVHRDADSVVVAVADFLADSVPTLVVTDGGSELAAALQQLNLADVHRTTVPNDHQSNGIAERQIGIVTEATKAALYQAGAPLSAWRLAAPFVADMTNCIRCDETGKTAYELVYKQQPPPTIPFGSLIGVTEPIETRRREHHPFGPNRTAGIMIGFQDEYRSILWTSVEDFKKKGVKDCKKARIADVIVERPHVFPNFVPVAERFRPAAADKTRRPPTEEEVKEKYTSEGELIEEGVNWWRPRNGATRPGEIIPHLWTKVGEMRRRETIKDVNDKYEKLHKRLVDEFHASNPPPPTTAPPSSSSTTPPPLAMTTTTMTKQHDNDQHTTTTTLSSSVPSSSSSSVQSLPSGTLCGTFARNRKSATNSPSSSPSSSSVKTPSDLTQTFMHSNKLSAKTVTDSKTDPNTTTPVSTQYFQIYDLDEDHDTDGVARLTDSRDFLATANTGLSAGFSFDVEASARSVPKHKFRGAVTQKADLCRELKLMNRELYDEDDDFEATTFRQRKDKRRLQFVSAAVQKMSDSDRKALTTGWQQLGISDAAISVAMTETPTHEEPPDNHSDRAGRIPMCLVTTSVTKKDPMYRDPRMVAAVSAEMDKLQRQGTWQPVPMTYKQARAVPNSKFVRGHCLRSLKGAEDPSTQKCKARLVCLGDMIKDAENNQTWFSDSSSCPVTMAMIKAGVYISCSEGQPPITADAVGAYCQGTLPESEAIFLSIAEDLLTTEQKQMLKKMNLTSKEVVWKLVKPLYGLSISASLWEKHFEAAAKRCGWTPIKGAPQSFHKRCSKTGKVQVLLAYVDDVLFCGVNAMEEYRRLALEVEFTPPEQMSRMLGISFGFEQGKSSTGHAGLKITMSMREYFASIVRRWEESGYSPLKPRRSPALEVSPEMLVSPEATQPGKLSGVSASFLMALLYGARMCRPDLVHQIVSISRHSARWTALADKRLFCLMCYVKTSLPLTHHGFVAFNSSETTTVDIYADADLAGDVASARSTSGGIVRLCSPKTGSYLITEFYSKRQTATAKSTCAAEVVSLSLALDTYAPAACSFLESIWKRVVTCNVYEDNVSTIMVAQRGYSSALRGLQKHFRICLSSLGEVLARSDYNIFHISTENQRADALTKGLSPSAHESALKLLDMELNK